MTDWRCTLCTRLGGQAGMLHWQFLELDQRLSMCRQSRSQALMRRGRLVASGGVWKKVASACHVV